MRKILIGSAAVAGICLIVMIAATLVVRHIRGENWAKCLNHDAAGCTALIELGRETAAALATIYYDRGNIYSGQGRYDDAVADYAKAIALRPDFVEAYNNRGQLYSQTRRYDEAFADFNKAIMLRPDLARPYNSRGVAYHRESLYDQAIADFTRAVAHDPDYATAYLNRGYAYGRKELYDEAVADFTKAIALKPDLASGYYARAIVYARQRHYDQAIADYTRAITLKPDDEAYYGRAWTYHKMGEDAKGLPDAEHAVALAPKVSAYLETRGEIHEKLGQRDAAVADYRAALMLDVNQRLAEAGLLRLGATPWRYAVARRGPGQSHLAAVVFAESSRRPGGGFSGSDSGAVRLNFLTKLREEQEAFTKKDSCRRDAWQGRGIGANAL